jgi:hypothetical protein
VPDTWEDFKYKLNSYFKSAYEVRSSRDRLAALIQNESIADYVDTFLNLQLHVPDLYEPEAIDKFVRGLSEAAQVHVLSANRDCLDDYIKTTLDFESAYRTRFRQLQELYFRGTAFAPPQPVIQNNDVYNRPLDPMNIYSIVKATMERINALNICSNPNRRIRGNCNYCKKQGHRERNCRKRTYDENRGHNNYCQYNNQHSVNHIDNTPLLD